MKKIKKIKPTLEAIQLFQEGTLCLAEMELNGIRIDTEYLSKSLKEIKVKILDTENSLRKREEYKVWRKLYGEKSNLASDDQLGVVLYKHFKYPCYEVTPTGKPKTDKEALQKIDSDFVREYLYLIRIKDIGERFLKGIQKEVCDGYLHPSFDLNTAVSGRSSSSGPNFQNFPARDKEMSELIRKCFIAREGNYLAEDDFSTLEVRVAACVTKDPVLMDYMKDPSKDMHRDTASELFFLPVEYLKEHKDWAKKSIRDWAKNRFVFPEFYGSVFFQCAPHIWEVCSQEKYKLPDSGKTLREHLEENGIKSLGDCNPKEKPKPNTFEYHAKRVEDSFWNDRFKVYTQWKKRFWAEYITNRGYVTYTGFLVQWGKDGILSKNDCLNYVIQCPSFHCLLWTLIKVSKWLKKYKLKTKLIGQIHDSLLADVPPNELQDFLSKVNELISIDLAKHWEWINVPMNCEAEVCDIGTTWYHKKQWDIKEGIWKPVG